MRVLIAEAVHNPEFARLLGENGPLRVWQLLADYLDHKMDEGLLRRMEPDIAARCFIGPLILQIMSQKIFQLVSAMHIDNAALIKANIDIFLHGLQTPDSSIPASTVHNG